MINFTSKINTNKGFSKIKKKPSCIDWDQEEKTGNLLWRFWASADTQLKVLRALFLTVASVHFQWSKWSENQHSYCNLFFKKQSKFTGAGDFSSFILHKLNCSAENVFNLSPKMRCLSFFCYFGFLLFFSSDNQWIKVSLFSGFDRKADQCHAAGNFSWCMCLQSWLSMAD